MSASYNNGTVTFNNPVNPVEFFVIAETVTTVLDFNYFDEIDLTRLAPPSGPERINANDSPMVIDGVTFSGDALSYIVEPDAFGGTTVTASDMSVACLAVGSLIATPDGPRAIETLRPGDRILCHAGGAPVARALVGCETWTCDLANAGQPREVAPIRIAPGAFAAGVPARELVVSPNHAIHADGMLVPARHLVNGLSIVQDFAAATIRYVHVEMAGHDLMAAEGLLVETRLPQPVTTPHPGEWSQLWEAQSCAPLVVSGAALESLRARLLAQAASLGLLGGGIAPPGTLRAA
jgi:hypothetical protein